MPTIFDTPAELQEAIGSKLGSSEWLAIEQDRINLFADATGDHQWIHIDPERAKDGPFGACIAHGYLTLSLGEHVSAADRRGARHPDGGQLRHRQGAFPARR